MHSSTTPQAAPRILPLNYPLPIPLRLQLAAPHHPYPRPCLLSQSFCYSQLTRYHLHRIARLLASLQDTALIGAGMGWGTYCHVSCLFSVGKSMWAGGNGWRYCGSDEGGWLGVLYGNYDLTR